MTLSKNTRGLTRRKLLEVVGTGAVAGAVSSILPAPAIASAPTLRIGYISPQTGALAPFAEADPFMLGKVREVLKDGLKVNGTNYKVEITAIDDQSNSDRSATSASQLINGNGVNLMLAQGALPHP